MWELSIIPALILAFGVGSNDSSNALGICIGAGVIKLRKALLLFGIMVFLGVSLKGQKIITTIGEELVETNFYMITISMFIAGLLIILSNTKKLPLSTHQVLIGALIGGAVALNLKVNTKKLIFIILSWILSPIVALIFSFIIGLILEKNLQKLSFAQVEKLLRNFLLFSAALLSFNTGANELATVLAPVYHLIPIKYHLEIFALGSLTVFLGSYLLSYKVIETIGKGITALDPFSGFAAQLGAGLCVYLFTSLGMPVSTTYCIVGAVIGIGLTKGIYTVKTHLVKKIALNLSFTPLLSFALGYIITLGFKFF